MDVDIFHTDGKEDVPWDFKSVRQFLHAFSSSDISPPAPDPSLYNPKSDVPKSLGDFDRLLAFCGKPLDIPPPTVRRLSYGSSSSANSDPSTVPSSVPDDNVLDAAEQSDIKAKGVRWKDQVPRSSTSKRRRVQAGSGELDASVVARLLETDESDESDTDEDDEDIFNTRRPKKSTPLIPASILLPSSSKPFQEEDTRPPPLMPTLYQDPTVIRPIRTLTENEQKAKIIKKMLTHFQYMNESRTIPLSLSQLGAVTVPGIHVFVDLSNIVIGFYTRIKLNRGLHEKAHVKNPPFSFRSLAMILERGRKVARRVVVGSTISSLYKQPLRVPSHVTEAAATNYELNILERVSKPQSTVTPKKARHGSGSGYVTSGHSSASESTSVRLAMQEQAVDEILQMKILETLVDTQAPSTIVLASGDAAEAEYSGGFLTNVERALRKGWKVEVVAWSQGLSHEYRRKAFLSKWKNNFTYVKLDDYCEEMLGVYTQKYKYSGIGMMQ